MTSDLATSRSAWVHHRALAVVDPGRATPRLHTCEPSAPQRRRGRHHAHRRRTRAPRRSQRHTPGVTQPRPPARCSRGCGDAIGSRLAGRGSGYDHEEVRAAWRPGRVEGDRHEGGTSKEGEQKAAAAQDAADEVAPAESTTKKAAPAKAAAKTNHEGSPGEGSGEYGDKPPR